jgi:CubicO group peptidase (beta-lactamase class C family)
MRRTIAVLLAIVGTAASCQAQAPDSVARAVDRVFDSYRGTDGPGCAVGVSRDGKPIYERGYGMANLETKTPIEPASIFHVASVSKQFTAAAIMLLERDGKLSVDDDIRKYLPEIPDYGTTITIRHLLTHTSGLRDQWELLSLARGRFEENRINEADVMDIVPRQTALNFKPGAEYLYSNTGFTLLGVIVKRVSGKSLKDFADERIFKPLGMTSTHFHDDYTMVVPGRAWAYAPRGNGSGTMRWRSSIPNYDVYGATSLFTTVGDMLKWTANLDHPTVGDAAMYAWMQTVTPLTNGDTSSYGFGLSMSRYRGARVVDHNGADAGYRSYLGRLPDQAVSVAIACNVSTANTNALFRGVADAVVGSALGPVAAVSQQGTSLPVEKLQTRAGYYFQPTTTLVVHLVVRDGKLVLDAPGSPTLIPLDEKRFALPAQEGDLLFADGEHAGYVRRIPGQQPIPFEWKQGVSLTAAMLAPYAGEYVSAELAGAVYRVAVKDSTLTMRTGTSEPLTMRPVFADTFLAAGYTVQFSRAGSRITGFDVSNSRIRHVKFVKKP